MFPVSFRIDACDGGARAGTASTARPMNTAMYWAKLAGITSRYKTFSSSANPRPARAP